MWVWIHVILFSSRKSLLQAVIMLLEPIECFPSNDFPSKSTFVTEFHPQVQKSGLSFWICSCRLESEMSIESCLQSAPATVKWFIVSWLCGLSLMESQTCISFTPENLLQHISIKKWEFYRSCHEDDVIHVGRTLLAHALLKIGLQEHEHKMRTWCLFFIH